MATLHSLRPAEGAQVILERLKYALSHDGDFPVRAKIITDLRLLVENQNTPLEKIVECILREPSLGTRILHLVNSGFYGRPKQILTVSQAVVQLGTRAIVELCSGLVLLQRFIPSARRGGVFSENVTRSMVVSLSSSALARCLPAEGEGLAETGYLAGTFYSIGTLLLAYYFPNVIEQAARRSETKRQTIRQSLTEILGVTPVELSLGVVDSLSIPTYYRDVIFEAHALSSNPEPGRVPTTVSHAVAAANGVANLVMEARRASDIESGLSALVDVSGFPLSDVTAVVRTLPGIFHAQCKMVEMTTLTLPDAISEFVDRESKEETAPASNDTETFAQGVSEIREAIDNGDTLLSVATSVMELLVYCLHFERAMLMMTDPQRSHLEGKMSLGEVFPVEAHARKIPLASTDGAGTPEVKAISSRQVEVYGDPLFADGWPFAAIPIGSSDTPVGVIYVDKADRGDQSEPLDPSIKYALNILAELLDEAVVANT